MLIIMKTMEEFLIPFALFIDKIKSAMTKWTRSYDKILAFHDKMHDSLSGKYHNGKAPWRAIL